jgi:predicted nucleotidyltransferase
MDPTKVTGTLSERLAEELLNVKNSLERNQTLKNAANSQQADHLQDAVEPERLHDKMQNVQENERVMDQVHISEKAQAMYRAHEAKLEGAPERVHNRLQDPSNEEPKPAPEPTTGVLGNLDPES